MKKVQTTILLDQDIVNSLEFRQLSAERRLSRLINDLLTRALNITRTEHTDDIIKAEQELMQAKIMLTMKEEEYKKLKESADMEAKKWKRLEDFPHTIS